MTEASPRLLGRRCSSRHRLQRRRERPEAEGDPGCGDGVSGRASRGAPALAFLGVASGALGAERRESARGREISRQEEPRERASFASLKTARRPTAPPPHPAASPESGSLTPGGTEDTNHRGPSPQGSPPPQGGPARERDLLFLCLLPQPSQLRTRTWACSLPACPPPLGGPRLTRGRGAGRGEAGERLSEASSLP